MQDIAARKLEAAIKAGEPSAKIALMHKRLAELYEKSWEHGKKAILQYDLALAAAEHAHGESHHFVGELLCGMAYCVAEMQRHRDRPNMQSDDKKWMTMDIRPLVARALTILRTELGDTHPFVLKTLRVHADVLDGRAPEGDAAKVKEAHEAYKEALGLQETYLGATHPDTLETMNNLGDFLNERFEDDPDKVEEAINTYEKALRAAIKRMDLQHPLARMLLENLHGTVTDLPCKNKAERVSQCEGLMRQMGPGMGSGL